MESLSNGDLPAEIILEILLRLPVKILLRFKCVCKQWYTLIGSRSFVDQHFGHESNLESLLIQYGKHHPSGRCTFALYIDETFSRYEEPDHLKVLEKAAVILGPLNGVFCVLSKSKNIALLNPAMRQFKPLPFLRWVVQPHLSSDYSLLGFGVDLLNGDYKLVWIQYFWNDEMNMPHYPPLVYIYNSGSDSSKHIEDVNLVDLVCSEYGPFFSTFLNGVCYWVVNNNGIVAILAFDMSSEKFQKIQVPNCIEYEVRSLSLALYGDSIALLSYDNVDKIDNCIDIWVMRKERSWTKSFTIGPFEDIIWPLGFWKNDELLLEGYNSVLAVNVSNQKLRIVATRGEEVGFMFNRVFSYKESLVSIKREGDNCVMWDTSSDLVKYFFRYSSTNG